MISARRRRVATFAGLALLGAVGSVPRHANAADPSMAECLTANESSIKLRQDHKLREAREQSLVCASSSCPAEVRDACQTRVARLNAEVPTIVFEAKDARGADLTRVVVTMDGQPFAAHLDGSAIPLDPGEHVFVFAAEGAPKVEKRFVLYQGETNRREKIQMPSGAQEAAPPTQPPVPEESQAPTPEASQSPTPEASPGMGTQKVVGLVVGGLGIVGLGVGAATGLVASSAWSKVESACGSGGASNCSAGTTSRSSVTSNRDSAQTYGTVSTVAFVAGGVLLAAGVVLYLTGGPGARQTSGEPHVALEPTLGPGQAGFALRGGF